MFVVAIAQLSAGVGNAVGVREFLILAGLFIPIWWAWVGFTFYADRFDTDDALHRVVMFAGMFAVAALASTIPEAYEGDTTGFAVSYAVVRLIVVALNARAWWHLPAARPLLNAYIPAFTASALLFLVSAALPAPARYTLWAAALAIDLGTPLVSAERIRLVPIHTSHIPERVGLFTIIVFGETVLAVVIGTETVSWAWDSGLVAALGFATAAVIWWLYFDYLGAGIVRRTIAAGQVYLFAHLPLLIGLTAFGVGVKLAIKSTGGDRLLGGTAWMLGGGAALVLASMALIHVARTLTMRDLGLWLRVGAVLVAIVGAALGDMLGAVGLSALLAAAVGGRLVLELARHQRQPSLDLELVGNELEGRGPSIPMDSHANRPPDQVADH